MGRKKVYGHQRRETVSSSVSAVEKEKIIESPWKRG
jgi:hypothetical protein